MADRSPIEWLRGPDGRQGATWNPIVGCSVVSPGCTNCYAMRLAGTRMKSHPSRVGLTRDSKAGPVWTGEVRFMEPWLTQPLRWSKPRMIFVCAHADLFHEAVPDEWIDRVFAVMALCPQHTFQVLTKRPARMHAMMKAVCRPGLPERVTGVLSRMARDGVVTQTDAMRAICRRVIALPNVWLGVSVEDQRRADERIGILGSTPAALRWVSAEPLLGRIDFDIDQLQVIDWVVAGGESGPGARPMHPDWARSLRDQCAAAGVPFLFKQWGEWAPAEDYPSEIQEQYDVQGLADGHSIRVGKKAAGRLLDGVIHDGYPEARPHG